MRIVRCRADLSLRCWLDQGTVPRILHSPKVETKHTPPNDPRHENQPPWYDHPSPLTPKSNTLQVLGRLFHLSIDAVLVSTVLAGISRSSGLQYSSLIPGRSTNFFRRVKTDSVENKNVRSAVTKYLNIGEWVMDQSVAFMSTTSYFERKR